MKISIDEDVVSKLTTLDGKKLSVGELLVCLLIRLDYNIYEVIEELVNKGVLLKDPKIPDNLMIFTKYSKLTERILLQSDKSVPKAEELTDLAKQLQELWPKGKKKDDFGVDKWLWRGNTRDITTRLQKFYKIYGNGWPPEKFIQAAKNYLERYKYDLKHLKLLQYFIMKHTEEGLVSELANELEALDCGEEETISNDWMINISTNE